MKDGWIGMTASVAWIVFTAFTTLKYAARPSAWALFWIVLFGVAVAVLVAEICLAAQS